MKNFPQTRTLIKWWSLPQLDTSPSKALSILKSCVEFFRQHVRDHSVQEILDLPFANHCAPDCYQNVRFPVMTWKEQICFCRFHFTLLMGFFSIYVFASTHSGWGRDLFLLEPYVYWLVPHMCMFKAQHFRASSQIHWNSTLRCTWFQLSLVYNSVHRGLGEK